MFLFYCMVSRNLGRILTPQINIFCTKKQLIFTQDRQLYHQLYVFSQLGYQGILVSQYFNGWKNLTLCFNFPCCFLQKQSSVFN